MGYQGPGSRFYLGHFTIRTEETRLFAEILLSLRLVKITRPDLSMIIRRNVIANYLGLAYTSLIGVVMMPVYLHYLGGEAYGLIGFFVVLQSWLALLSMGLFPTLARQVAYTKDEGEAGKLGFLKLLRSVELVFILLGLATGIGCWLASPWVASQWLAVTELSHEEVAYCISLMGLMVGLRWAISLYQCAIQGLERQVWLNGFNVLVSSLRYVAIYVMLRWVSQEPAHFFEFQLMVSLLELVICARKFYTCFPVGEVSNRPGISFSWPEVRKVLPFASGVAYTSALWVLMTQTDKLILSHLLPLQEFGYFAIVIVFANIILKFSEPITIAVLPRMTALFSRGQNAQMLALYRKSTQYLAVVAFSVAGTMAAMPEELLFALTGSSHVAQWGAGMLRWYALGNGILIVAGIQYTLQHVHGRVGLHAINSSINAVLQVPIMALSAIHYGAIGAAVAWFTIRLIAFLVWPAIVHRKFAPGLHVRWLVGDVLPALLAVLLVVGAATVLFSIFPQLLLGRWQIVLALVITGIACLAFGGAASGMILADFIILGRKVRHMPRVSLWK